MAYATRDEVLQRMGQAGKTGDIADRVDDALLAATEGIDEDTGRVFTQSSGARTFATPNGWVDVMDVPDLRSINTLKFDDDDDGVFETTITAYELDQWMNRDGWAFDRLRLLDRSFPCGGRRRRRIEIDADWGWAAVPAQINQACSLLAARLAQRSSTALFGTESFGELGAASIRSSDPDYQALIRPYRKLGIK